MKLSEKIKLVLEEGAGDLAFGVHSVGAPVETKEVEVETETEVETLSEDVKLSGDAIKNLSLMAIAEKLINESVDETNEELIEVGFLAEGKLTLTAKQWLEKYLPTIFAS